MTGSSREDTSLCPSAGQGAGTGQDAERTLDDVQREFPSWLCWERNGLCYARRQHAPRGDYDAHGDNPSDLREAILLALSRDDRPVAMPAPDGQPTLADVQREFPGWSCWESSGGLLYARCQQAPAGRPDVWGQDPPGLREAILRFLRTPEHDALTTAPAKDTL